MIKKVYPYGKLKAFLKIIIIILIIIIIKCMLIIIPNYFSKNKISKIDGETIAIDDSTQQEIELPPDITINMAVIGDIMCHNTQYMDACINGNYDFSYVFDDIKDELENADIAVGNLETTFAGSNRGYSSYPTFNTPEALATDLKEVGIDLLCTANNHSLDTGYSGIESTINYLDNAGILHTGTYSSEETSNKTIIAKVNGIKIAFLSFTYGTNGIPIPNGREYCINLIDKNFILQKLDLAKKQNPDIICVFMPWGEEYETTPNVEQKELADFLFQNGANVILGSHPHVLQRMEKKEILLEDGSSKEGFVIYSLGNFMSGQVKENTRDSIILNLTLTKKGTGEITIDKVKYIPIYTYKKANGTLQRYKVLDIKKALDAYNNGNKYITSDEYNLLIKEYNKIISTMGDEIIE